MIPNARRSTVGTCSVNTGPLLIAVGLIILLAATWLPALPLVTAMALITLGATLVTIARFVGSIAFATVLLLHAATYAMLYGLFVAAALHTSFDGAQVQCNTSAIFDLALSTLPICIALRHFAAAVRGV